MWNIKLNAHFFFHYLIIKSVNILQMADLHRTAFDPNRLSLYHNFPLLYMLNFRKKDRKK